jgi:hypothetical protein
MASVCLFLRDLSNGGKANPWKSPGWAKTGHRGAPAISAQPGAGHYRFLALEITTTFSTLESVQYGLVDLGEDLATGESATSVSELPHDITIDRCYIHGTPNGNVKRGIALNGASLAVIDSYISDIHVVGQDTQTIAGWNGPGPFKIVDNELEADS